MDKSLIIFVTLMLMATGIWSYNLGTMTTLVEPKHSAGDIAQEVCDASRGTISGEFEEACGIALDAAEVNYICKSSNGPCYVEAIAD